MIDRKNVKQGVGGGNVMELLPHLITNALLQNILERLADGEVVIGDGSYCNTLEKRGYCKVNKRGYCKVN